jgi:osomolarity two-component system sensor histidine kinase SLN1
MDGLEATRLIREAGYRKPIVALSAYSDDTNVKGCHDAGMDDFVSKPIQLARLKLVLKTFCPEEYAAITGSGPMSLTTGGGSKHRREGGSRLRKETASGAKEGSSGSNGGAGVPPSSSGTSNIKEDIGGMPRDTPTPEVQEEEDDEYVKAGKGKGRRDEDEGISPMS